MLAAPPKVEALACARNISTLLLYYVDLTFGGTNTKFAGGGLLHHAAILYDIF